MFLGLALPITVVQMISATRPPAHLGRAVLLWAISHVVLAGWIAFAPSSLHAAVTLALKRKETHPKARVCLAVFLILLVGYSTGFLGLIACF